MTATYSEFQKQTASEKTLLAVVEARKRLKGWVVHSGDIYKLNNFSAARVVNVEDSGVAYARESSVELDPGEYFHDLQNSILYLNAEGSVNPNSLFLVVCEYLYFSTHGVSLPYDHGTWSGYDVYYRDGIEKSSEFSSELDSENQIGEALEGTGSLSLKNDQDFWKPIFEKKSFSNGKVFIYSWNRELPVTEAKILYRGKIQGKTYSPQSVTFNLIDQIAELRATVPLPRISLIPGALINQGLSGAFQRRIYGEVKGYRPSNIDQVSSIDGYALTGTVKTESGSAILTGTGTSFLSDLSPDDEILIEDLAQKVTIATIESDTLATLSEDSTSSRDGKNYVIFPAQPKRYTNRVWNLASHSLREPSTTVVSATNSSQVIVTNGTDLDVGAELLVGTDLATVRRQTPGNRIRLEVNLSSAPAPGTVVKRLPVTNVRINKDILIYSRDYVFDSDDASLTLNPLAEFNIAPLRFLAGVLTFVAADRTVTGTLGTAFTSQLKSGDWIRAADQSDWKEILQIVSDTELQLRTVPGYDSSTSALLKSPHIYEEGTDVLSCDILGCTVDGTKEGEWVNSAPKIVRHLLVDAGLEADIDDDTFTEMQGIAYAKLGLVVPENYTDKKCPTYRATISLVDKSVFGSLIQTPDYKYQFHVLRPRRLSSSALRLDEADALSWSVGSQIQKMVKNALVEYVRKEYNWETGDTSTVIETFSHPDGAFLGKAVADFNISTRLIEQKDAEILAQRLAFLFATPYTTIKIRTKMQAARSKISDVVDFAHEKLYEKVGSTSRRKIGAVSASSRDGASSEIEIEDLANTLCQCGVITETDAPTWDNSDEDHKTFNGFVTDSYGMQDNDPETFGINRIW